MLKTLRIQSADTMRGALVLLHGLGASAEQWQGFAGALQLPDDIAVFLPQAPTRAVTLADQAQLPAWFDIYGIQEDADEDDAGIDVGRQAVQQLIDDLIAEGAAPQKIFIGGFSQGGAMALHVACHSPQTLGGVLAMSAYLPLRCQFTQTRTQTPPVFMSHGRADPVIPIHYAEIARDILTQGGCSVSWHSYPLDHTLDENVIADVKEWLGGRMAER